MIGDPYKGAGTIASQTFNCNWHSGGHLQGKRNHQAHLVTLVLQEPAGEDAWNLQMDSFLYGFDDLDEVFRASLLFGRHGLFDKRRLWPVQIIPLLGSGGSHLHATLAARV